MLSDTRITRRSESNTLQVATNLLFLELNAVSPSQAVSKLPENNTVSRF